MVHYAFWCIVVIDGMWSQGQHLTLATRHDFGPLTLATTGWDQWSSSIIGSLRFMGMQLSFPTSDSLVRLLCEMVCEGQYLGEGLTCWVLTGCRLICWVSDWPHGKLGFQHLHHVENRVGTWIGYQHWECLLMACIWYRNSSMTKKGPNCREGRQQRLE